MFSRKHTQSDGDESRDGFEENEEDHETDVERNLFDLKGREEGFSKSGVWRSD